jgi:hypothetical protein
MPKPWEEMTDNEKWWSLGADLSQLREASGASDKLHRKITRPDNATATLQALSARIQALGTKK